MPRASPPDNASQFVSRRDRPEHQQRRAGTGRQITSREFGVLGRHTGAKLQQAAKDFQGFDDLDQAWKSESEDDQENAGAQLNRSSLFPESPQSVSTAPNDPEPEIAAKRLEFNANNNEDDASADLARDDAHSASESESENEHDDQVPVKKALANARGDDGDDTEPELTKKSARKGKSKLNQTVKPSKKTAGNEFRKKTRKPADRHRDSSPADADEDSEADGDNGEDEREITDPPSPVAKQTKKGAIRDVRKKARKPTDERSDTSPIDQDENQEPDDENADEQETVPDHPSPAAKSSKKGTTKDARKKTKKVVERSRGRSSIEMDKNGVPNEDDVDEHEKVPDPSPASKPSKKSAVKDVRKKTRNLAEKKGRGSPPIDLDENSDNEIIAEPENVSAPHSKKAVVNNGPSQKQKRKPAGKARTRSPIDDDETREPSEESIDEPDPSPPTKTTQSKSKPFNKSVPAKKKRRQTLMIIDEAQQSGLIEPETIVIENDKRVRRSHRARCRPVNFFECEQPNYIRGPGGLFTLDRQKTTIKHVPTPPPPQARRVRTKRRRPKSWDESSDEEEELVPLSGETKVIGPNGKERRQIVAVRASDLSVVKLTTRPPAGVQAQNKDRGPSACKFDGLSGVSSGIIRIPATGTKYPETASRTEVLFVASCERNSLRVKVNGHEFVLSKGDCFMVPVNNMYSIQNTSGRKQAELFFSALPPPSE